MKENPNSNFGEIKETPLMKQFLQMKAQYPDAILLFRVGDFYETFGQDAVTASKILGITLTKRANGAASHIELAGFPYHSIETYMPKLVRAGLRVAVCEQLEDPKKTKTIVKRGVTELVTPGTALSDKVLEMDSNNYLAAIHFGKSTTGVALLDLSTGEFFTTEGTLDYILKILENFKPSELLHARSYLKTIEDSVLHNYYNFQLEDYLFEKDFSVNTLLTHFKTQNLKGFGVEHLNEGLIASGIILHYLTGNRHSHLEHISSLKLLEGEDVIWLDRFSLRNLELVDSQHPDGKTLFQVLNKTSTPMGNRELKKWLMMPLKNLNSINARLKITNSLYEQPEIRESLQEYLSSIGDIERLIAKISLQKCSPRDVIALKNGLENMSAIKGLLSNTSFKELSELVNELNSCVDIIDYIKQSLNDEAPVQIQKGGTFKKGFHPELDEWKSLSTSGKDTLLKIQQKEVIETGITSLKISYNNVFGYFLEVTNVHKSRVPSTWIRKQTLVNAERYITPELKEYEEKILQAEEKILAIETELFAKIIEKICSYTAIIQLNAKIIARIDVHNGLAITAKNENYVLPVVDNGYQLDIKQGRHPVIEKALPIGEAYIPNDVYLDNELQQIIIITGPNMSGKSAILRQTALITLMSHIGSFVPATSAHIGLVDKIFTRVGANDHLSLGESTFMVEMTEAAYILNNFTRRSLIVLDEIGRGTSTYDGVSIAWAITEHLHNHEYQPKTLFATHYHEMNEIYKTHPRIKNFHVAVKETGNSIIFLRKLVEGGSEHSFGIHVAQMAGLPPNVVRRAGKILGQLEAQKGDVGSTHSSPKMDSIQPDYQLKIFEMTDTAGDIIKKEINGIDINTITPLEALMKIHHIKNLMKKEK